MNNLVIVESPNKIDFLKKILGHNYCIVATIGHIEGLLENNLSVEKHSYFPIIEVKRANVLQNILQRAKASNKIFLATDPDREGESIAFSVYRHLDDTDKNKCCRIRFKSLQDIKFAIHDPQQINMNLVKAQMARRVLDRLIGFGLTYAVRKQIGNDFTVGRVQTPILNQVVLNTKQYLEYTPETIYQVTTIYDVYGSVGAASMYLTNSQIVTNKNDINKIVSINNAFPYTVKSIIKTTKIVPPPQAYNTYSLISDAFNSINYTASQTMQASQGLFEKGLITYPRTENTDINKDINIMLLKYVQEHYGDKYIQNQYANQYYTLNSAAHIAILPCYPNPQISQASKEEKEVYELIFQQALMSVMSPAVIDIFDIHVVDRFNRKSIVKASELAFDGWSRINPDKIDLPYQPLPFGLKQNMQIRKGYVTTQTIQKPPPPLMNDALITKLMAEKGIGKPSTIVSTINNITNQQKGYVTIQPDNTYKATEKSKILTDFVKEKYPSIIDLDFTKQVETLLDKIEKDELKYTDGIKIVLDEIKKKDQIDLTPEAMPEYKGSFANMDI